MSDRSFGEGNIFISYNIFTFERGTALSYPSATVCYLAKEKSISVYAFAQVDFVRPQRCVIHLLLHVLFCIVSLQLMDHFLFCFRLFYKPGKSLPRTYYLVLLPLFSIVSFLTTFLNYIDRKSKCFCNNFLFFKCKILCLLYEIKYTFSIAWFPEVSGGC